MKELKNLDKKVYCTVCKGKRNHKILSTYSESSNYGDDYHWNADYHIVKCAGCETVAFVRQYGDEDTWDYDESGERVWVDTFTVFPEEPKEEVDAWWEHQKIKKKDFKHVPKDLKNLYDQILESYNEGHFVLCTSGLRTLIEGICSHLGIKKGFNYDENREKLPNDKGQIVESKSLGGRIFGLFENGHIVFPYALILQKVKVIGNSAIHEIVVPDSDDIQKMIHILEGVMHDIYELKNNPLLKN